MNNDILRDAVAKLIKAKGRFHTEQNYANLVRAFDATAERSGLSAAEIDDMCFGYAPSGKIGELRELLNAYRQRLASTFAPKGPAAQGGVPEAVPAIKQNWQSITAPGQVKVGDKLRFTIGDDKFNETVKLIIRRGLPDEEIIYNKARNYYVITSMCMKNAGSSKNVEFLPAPTGASK